ncbi:uncharacterized protein LOC127730649 [Mytilus californianus]|uniref:uncharacterized protein LOC127730649 n=1 Tax=Mytilus californianus TaxID=6549 RepID=UPI002247CDA0|nr:uncharacterized protein LOC127730649 [Mytilus californianus]
MAELQPILNKYIPDLRGNIRVDDILYLVNFPSSGTEEITRYLESDNKDDIARFIEVIGRIDDNNNNLHFSVSFLKCLQNSKASGIHITAEQMISEAEKVFPKIREHFLPPSLTKSGTKQSETSCNYLRDDIANVRPSTSTPRSSTQADIGITSSHGELKILTTINGQPRSQNSRHSVTQNEIGLFCAGKEIEDIPNELFLQLVMELNKDKQWEKFGNKMGLKRKEMKEFEKSEDPAKMLLDYVGDRTLGELVYTFQAAGIPEIPQKLNISLKEEPTGTKLRSLENEEHGKLEKFLNENKRWELLANKLQLKRRQVAKLERKDNPAKSILDDHRHLTTEQLYIKMQDAGLHFDSANENPTTNVHWSDGLPTQRLRYINNLDEEIKTQEEEQLPLNITESISESITDNTNSNKLFPSFESSSVLSTGRFEVRDGSFGEHSITYLKNVASQERTELLEPNRDVLPLIVLSNVDLDNRGGADSPENTETIPVSEHLDNGQHMSQVSVIVSSEKPIVTCPEDETQSEKNPEMATTTSLNDADAQYRTDEFRDIQNSVPYTSENHCSRVDNPVNEAKNDEHPEKAAQILSSRKKETTRTAITATNLSSPSDTNDSEEKNPEQECAALINDGTAQIVGTGYRDLQNSLPDSLSSDEMEEN